jgi:hypothetical protein
VYGCGKFGQDALRDDAIKLTQDQPFGAAGGAGDRANSFLGKAVCLDVLEGRRARLEAQRSFIQLIYSVLFRRAYDPEFATACKD